MPPRPSSGSSRKSRSAGRAESAKPARRSGGFNPNEVLVGFLLLLLGGGALVGLFQAAITLKFDTLLVVSKTIYNVITGLRGIALGFGQMLLGLGQMLALAGLALVTVAAVLAVLSGAVRVGRNALPQLGILWKLLAGTLQSLLQLLALPLSIGTEPARPRVSRANVAVTSGDLDRPLRRRVA